MASNSPGFASAFESTWHDLRYARISRASPGCRFYCVAIAIIGLGIGASTTVFSVVNAILLRPLPFRDPQKLVWISNYDTGGLSGATTQVDYLLGFRAQNKSFSDLAAYFAFYGVGDNLLSGKRRAGAAQWRAGHSGEFLPSTGHSTADRALVQCGGMQMERTEGCSAGPRHMGKALQRGSSDRR